MIRNQHGHHIFPFVEVLHDWDLNARFDAGVGIFGGVHFGAL